MDGEMTTDVAEQTDAEITSEFEQLFAAANAEQGLETETETEDDESNSEEEEVTEEEDQTTEDDEDGDDDSNENQEDETDDSEGAEDKPKETKAERKKRQQNYAVGKMRTENKQYQQLITRMAKTLGIKDTKDLEAVEAKINAAILKKESEQQGVPEEYLAEMEKLRAEAAELKSARMESEFVSQFDGFLNSFKEAHSYELTQEEADAFVAELVEDGKHPYEVEGINYMAEYMARHSGEVVKKVVELQTSAETKRRQNSAETAPGTLPGATSGSEEEKPDKIEDVDALDKYLDKLAKA